MQQKNVKKIPLIPEICCRGSVVIKQQQQTPDRDFRGKDQGFTLIELLVVVLIIGILAAVAVPQYQNAVEKSKAAQAFAVLKSVAQAQQAYYLANGVYALSFDELAVDMSAFTGSVPWNKNKDWFHDAHSNEYWSFQLSANPAAPGDSVGITAGRISGPLAGGALAMSAPDFTLECREPKDTATSQYDFGFSWHDSGAFCKRLFKATNPKDMGFYTSWQMP